ncbi:MAG TPA: response regulator [Puia sp.]
MIDDDYDHLLVCSLLLKKRGYDIFSLAGCKEIEELIRTVETFRPQLIYMDHEMQGICGADLTRALKSHPEFKNIPVIYFSGRDDIVQLAEQARADDYLKKPLKLESLLEITHKYLAQD